MKIGHLIEFQSQHFEPLPFLRFFASKKGYFQNTSFETLSDQFTLSTQLIKPKLSCYTPPPLQHHSFWKKNLPTLHHRMVW